MDTDNRCTRCLMWGHRASHCKQPVIKGCTGTLCPKRGKCQSYHALEGPGDGLVIGTCLNFEGMRPRYSPRLGVGDKAAPAA